MNEGFHLLNILKEEVAESTVPTKDSQMELLNRSYTKQVICSRQKSPQQTVTVFNTFSLFSEVLSPGDKALCVFVLNVMLFPQVKMSNVNESPPSYIFYKVQLHTVWQLFMSKQQHWLFCERPSKQSMWEFKETTRVFLIKSSQKDLGEDCFVFKRRQ